MVPADSRGHATIWLPNHTQPKGCLSRPAVTFALTHLKVLISGHLLSDPCRATRIFEFAVRPHPCLFRDGHFPTSPLQPRIDGFTLEGEDSEDAFMDPVERLVGDEALESLDAESELPLRQ